MEVQHFFRIRWRDGYAITANVDHVTFAAAEDLFNHGLESPGARARVTYQRVERAWMATVEGSVPLPADGGRPGGWRHALVAGGRGDQRGALADAVARLYGDEPGATLGVVYRLLSTLPRQEGSPVLERSLPTLSAVGFRPLVDELLRAHPSLGGLVSAQELGRLSFAAPPEAVAPPSAPSATPDRGTVTETMRVEDVSALLEEPSAVGPAPLASGLEAVPEPPPGGSRAPYLLAALVFALFVGVVVLLLLCAGALGVQRFAAGPAIVSEEGA